MALILSIDYYVLSALLILLPVAWHLLESYRKLTPLNNISGPPSGSFLTGNIIRLFSRESAPFQREVALDYGPVVRLCGPFKKPILYISDPTALHNILIKEDRVFEVSKLFMETNYLLLGRALGSTVGEHHRKQRKMLTPVFSPKYMRHLLPPCYDIVHKLRDGIAAEVAEGAREVDVLDWCGRAALELIGQGGLGYSFDPLTERAPDEFGEVLKALFPGVQALGALRRFTLLFTSLGPAWFRRAVVDMIPSKRVQAVKKMVDTIDARTREIYEAKQAAIREGDKKVMEQIAAGNDIMSLLMKANMAASDADRLPENEVIAQMAGLIFGATDTTSNTLARILELLAIHPEVQEQLREELLSSSAAEGLTYEELNRLPLLEGVCRETVRLYPTATSSSREATQDAVVPLGEPVVGLDGTVMRELHIPKGVEVVIGTLGCNAKKSLWGEDTLVWKPHRWMSPLPTAVSNAPIPGVYSNIMTFLGGKRACLGFKFSEMEMKVVLSVLVSKFTFELSDKPVQWNVGTVWYPTVGMESKPRMPLKVSLYKSG